VSGVRLLAEGATLDAAAPHEPWRGLDAGAHDAPRGSGVCAMTTLPPGGSPERVAASGVAPLAAAPAAEVRLRTRPSYTGPPLYQLALFDSVELAADSTAPRRAT